MSALEHEHDVEGGEGETAYAPDETTIDASQLKLPSFKWAEDATAGKTGEEDEDVIYKQKSIMSVWVGGEWKERCRGEVKLLKHKTKGIVRLLMRQDKTLKCRANFKIGPAIVPTVHEGSDQFIKMAADDYSEDKMERRVMLFKFKDNEVATGFKTAVDEARENNVAVLGGGAAPSPAKPAAGAGAAAVAPARAIDLTGPVLVTDSATAIYGADGASAAEIRIGLMSEKFRSKFADATPTFYARAPGRVNLIGEHVDYHGYSVFPMALSQDVLIAVSVGAAGDAIKVANTNDKYATATISTDPSTPVRSGAELAWYNYVQCGLKAVQELAKQKGVSVEMKGMNLLVDGTVPTGAGLSSSAALVVASALAIARALEVDSKFTRAELADACRKGELHIGTMGGGMDQAIACLAEVGKAARIDFEPLKATPVALPAGAVFVIANSLEESAKAVDAEKRYNKRVTEGKLAAKLLAKAAGVATWTSVQTLAQVQRELKLATPGALMSLIDAHLKSDAYSVKDVSAALDGSDVNTLFEGDAKKAGALAVLASVSAEEKAFELQKRARHVVSEAERVYVFEAACSGKARGADGSLSALEGSPLAAMGAAMNESQASCRDDYDCSSTGLDELVALATSNGALGARLTGAGWGGCMVALVKAGSEKALMEALTSSYYAKRAVADVASALFTTAPAGGAAVYTPPTSFEI